MGKTKKNPLIVYVHPDLVESLHVESADVRVWPSDLLSADLILGPTAWRITSEHLPYLPLAFKSARATRQMAKAVQAAGHGSSTPNPDRETGS